VDTGPYNRGKIARYYLARTRQSTVELLPSPDTGRPEHSEYRWVSLGEAHRLGSPRVRLALSWAENILSRGRGDCTAAVGACCYSSGRSSAGASGAVSASSGTALAAMPRLKVAKPGITIWLSAMPITRPSTGV
jgi:hypothetical protein